jgi:hypothetical protein
MRGKRERKDRNENESKDGRDTESNNSQTAESTITHCSIKRHHRFQILEKYIFTCEISSSHGGEYDVQSCRQGHTALVKNFNQAITPHNTTLNIYLHFIVRTTQKLVRIRFNYDYAYANAKVVLHALPRRNRPTALETV